MLKTFSSCFIDGYRSAVAITKFTSTQNTIMCRVYHKMFIDGVSPSDVNLCLFMISSVNSLGKQHHYGS